MTINSRIWWLPGSAALVLVAGLAIASLSGFSMGLMVGTGAAMVVVSAIAAWRLTSSLAADLGDDPSALRDAVRRIAAGDLDFRLDTHRAGTDSLCASLADMQGKFNQTIQVIRQATDSIGTASSEIASGNQDLSDRTEQTASNLQQTASSMEQLTGTVRQSADAARQANQLAAGAASAAQHGEIGRAHV